MVDESDDLNRQANAEAIEPADNDNADNIMEPK